MFLKNVQQRYIPLNLLFGDESYKHWAEDNEPDQEALQLQRDLSEGFTVKPKISIVTPVFNPDEKAFKAMLDSVAAQTYEHWELCLADASTKGYVRPLIDDFVRLNREARVKVKYLQENCGIIGNSNEALALATGEYVALLDHDDTLAPFALFEVAKAINQCHDADFIYSDRDILTYDDRRIHPFFKPDWSPDYLLTQNYLCHLAVLSKRLLDRIGWFREGYEGSQDYDLFLRATEAARNIVHIPQVLYHWRIVPGSAAIDPNAKPYAYDAAIKALEDAFARRSLKGRVEHGVQRGFYEPVFVVEHTLRVSIVILSKDGHAKTDCCISHILNITRYNNYDIVVSHLKEAKDASQGTSFRSDVSAKPERIIHHRHEPSDTRAEIINDIMRTSEAAYFIVLSEAAEIRSGDWIERLLSHAQRNNIGAVGAKLISSNSKIFAAGLILGEHGLILRAHHGFPENSHGDNGRICTAHNVSAVAGCIMVKRDVFESVGGFDPRFGCYAEIDFCLSARQRGYLVVYEPRAVVGISSLPCIGVTDHGDMPDMCDEERRRFFEKWGNLLKKGDPYYSPNLSIKREDFSFNV